MNTYKYKHAVIVGIDGMGNFNKDTETPNMDRIFADGAQTFYGMSLSPTISAQNWGAMLLGAEPAVHGLTNGIVGSTEYTNKELPSFFTALRKAYPDSFLCSCCNWDPINYGIIEHNIDVEMHTAPNDEELCPIIEECISRKPLCLFIQLDDVDGGGHGHGYGKEGHLKTIRTADSYVGRIYDSYKKAGIIDDTLFIVIADHGGYKRGHGGYTEGEKYIYFALAGKTVKKSEIPYAQTKDISAIILHAFRLDIPEYDFDAYSSQIPKNVFVDYDADYKKPEPVPFNFKTEETPSIDGKGGLLDYFSKDDIKFAMFFDNDAKDEFDKVHFKEEGRIKYYSTGRYSAMGEMGSIGYLVSDDIKFGKGSFSVAAWLKIDKSLGDICFVCGTKDMSKSGAGFTFGYSCANTMFGLETTDPDTYKEIVTPYLYDISDGWIHALYVVNKEAMAIDIYHNFELKRTVKLEDVYNTTVEAMPFTIGEDASHKCNSDDNYIFNIDDLIIFEKALSTEEVTKLAKYYKM